MSNVSVLVVDDSASMRGIIIERLQRDMNINVVGQATDALSARQAIKALNPDVVTLDIEMPNMNGLDFLEKIMRLRPMPVVMVSSLTKRGAEATIRAIELGAVDYVAKPTVEDPNTFDDLSVKVRAAAGARLRPLTETLDATGANKPVTRMKSGKGFATTELIAIGSSTGGVDALIKVLRDFPEDCPPTVVTQHMPPLFTKSFAQRLDRLCAPKVEEARTGAELVPGRIFIAPGGERHLEVVKDTTMRCRLRPGSKMNGHRPSVDVLFGSVAKCVGAKAVGTILTGMGNDGAQGLLAMRDAGARTIGQDEATCAVYGMPKVAFEIGAVGKQLPIEKISAEILSD